MTLPKEEVKRGGTEAIEPKPIEDPGQHIKIYAVPEGNPIVPETPNLV